MTNLLVSEIFGPTFQGEGSTAGVHCLFVRLALCNLECSFCDTPYTWAFTAEKAAKHMDQRVCNKTDETREMTAAAVVTELIQLWPLESQPTTVVITGGEPLMQQQALSFLLDRLWSLKCPIQIETAGTIIPAPRIDNYEPYYNVSPKLANSGNPLKKRRKYEPLEFFSRSQKVCFKFVVSQPEDLLEVDEIVIDFGIERRRVFIMPEGIETGTILDTAYAIEGEVKKRGYNLTLRNQILIYGNKRGT